MDGVIVASDQTLEWMLPWWLECYQKHNPHPVAFIDLGLSFEKKEWCKQQSELIPLRVLDFTEEVDPQTIREWEAEFGKRFWESRDAWFKKPLACLKSPFQRTLWIDVDCQICAPLSPLFEYAERPLGFAMAKDITSPTSGYPIYNSGVIAFRQNHPLLEEWAEACFTQNRLFRGDQEVFSHMIWEKKREIEELPPLYNWSRCLPERPDVIIHHWHGHFGKEVIRSLCSQQEWLSEPPATHRESPPHNGSGDAAPARESRSAGADHPP